MKKFLSLALVALFLTFTAVPAAHAQALDVASAKYDGLIGEQPDGLLGIVTETPSQAVIALVEETNKARNAIYQDMADKQRIDINQVRMMAGEKIYKVEKKGNYLKYTGQWKKK